MICSGVNRFLGIINLLFWDAIAAEILPTAWSQFRGQGQFHKPVVPVIFADSFKNPHASEGCETGSNATGHFHMGIGIHSDAVNEVFDFLKSGKLFTQPFTREMAEQMNCHLIDNFDHILDYWHAGEPGSLIVGFSWCDIMENTATDVPNWVQICSQYSSEFYLNLAKLIESEIPPFAPMIRSAVNGRIPEIYNYVCDYFDDIVYKRAQFGIHPESLYEKLFTILKAGGYPCGWLGEYPDGKLVVFSVKEESTTERL